MSILPARADSDHARDLRINEIVSVGTAESYKQRLSPTLMAMVKMGAPSDAKKLDFEMPTIPSQLDAGARLLSFDVAYDPKGGHLKNPAGALMSGGMLPDSFSAQMAKPGFKTVHVLDIDFQSNCQPLAACLAAVKTWSQKHPDHVPILIALTTNDKKTPMPRATEPLKIDAGALNALDAEIRRALGDRLLTPDMVRGSYPDLRTALLRKGWPRLAKARGRILVVLNDTPGKLALYVGKQNSLKGRAMFVTAAETNPNAAILAVEDPVKDAARIAAAVKSGFIVMTRADCETVEARANDTKRRDAAFRSGAQYIATNFLLPDRKIGSYQVRLNSTPEARRLAGTKPGARSLRAASPAGASALQPLPVRLAPRSGALQPW
jgi:hypothetical protein